MEKFRWARELLEAETGLEFIEPRPVTDEDLRRVHSESYIEAVRLGRMDGEALRRLGLPVRPGLDHRCALEAGGTLAAARAALEEGVACNLAGGTHHAFPDRGEGYCVWNDVAVAVRALQAEQRVRQVAVVDTDAHQGNGTHFIFRDDPSVATYSIHVGANYPSRKESGTCDVGLPRWVSGVSYLRELEASLPEFLDQFQAELVFWISGADVHEGDRFGQMRLSTEEVAERDRRVLHWLREIGRPLAVLFGGGYHVDPRMTARLHAASVCAAAQAKR